MVDAGERAEPVNVRINRLFGARRAAVRRADRLHLVLVGVRCRRARGQQRQPAPAAGAAAVRRGLIFARDGTRPGPQQGAAAAARIASSAALYPTGSLFPHPVGYSFVERGRVGPRTQVRGRSDRQGGRVRDAPRPAARQPTARATTCSRRSTRRRSGSRMDGLAGRAGSVVAIEPQTGRGAGDGERARTSTRTTS